MPRLLMLLLVVQTMGWIMTKDSPAEELIPVWPELAPGETTNLQGEALPARPNESPPITRLINITQPTFSVHRPEKPNGVAAIILPGGGFGKVVPDLEGTEAADWLNQIGVTAFVLRYRTTDDPLAPGWAKPLQDAQRLLARLRSEAETWKIDPDRLGIVAFSAGGQVGARLLCDQNQLAYKPLDQIDTVAHRPDFAILVYPWRITDDKTQTLISDLKVPTNCPPTCLIHTHDDKSTAVGAALFYAELRRHNIPAELHIYGNGGHGYGLRKIPGSQISSWPDHAGHWLQTLPLWK